MNCLVSFTFSAILLWMGTFCVMPTCFAANIPPALSHWQDWVLHDHEESFCPHDYNNAAVVRCQWPSQLKLDISSQGAQFEQRWLMFAKGWAALPGGSGSIWPQSVTVDGGAVAVIIRDNRPVVQLSPGEHRIMGRFEWSKEPEMIPVPPSIGLFSLSIEGREIHNPVIDGQGQVWLQSSGSESLREDTLKIRVFRLIKDSVPMMVTTLLRLDVSGNARETKLTNVLIPGDTPMDIRCPLPVRIQADGHVIIQLRPGQWDLYITTRRVGPQHKISAGPCPYGDEIWSFQPQYALRMVEILNVPPVEPTQTDMPAQWRALQAFVIKPNSDFLIKEVRRGDPEPAPDQLTLKRIWWLDFDGNGFTIHDKIRGTLNRQWYLAVNPPVQLGRVVTEGLERVITEQGPDKKMGVELRRGHLRLQADARIEKPATAMPALGWDHDFQSVAGTLHLPPGWRLIAATGVDTVSDSWLLRWSLLDFFLVLIITLALFKLRSWKWAVVGFFALVLIFHEPGAPRWVWLHICAVLALLPVLPEGWLKRGVKLWGIGAVVVLLLAAIPFIVNQIRWGVYPQLAPVDKGSAHRYFDDEVSETTFDASRFAKRSVSEPARVEETTRKAKMPKLDTAAPKVQPMSQVQQQDPKAIIPTGPGLPRWQWQATDLGWSGPVAKTQHLRFYLLSPVINLVLAFLRVVLLLMMIWSLLDWRMYWRRWANRLSIASSVLILSLCVGALLPKVGWAEASVFPPADLLQELRRRLTEKPDCFPQCADISRLELIAQGNDLQLLLKVSSVDRMAIALPVNSKSWTPQQILMDYAPISGLTRDTGGQLWAMIPPGLHTVLLKGDVGQQNVVRIPLPMKPHLAAFTVNGWRLAGIHDDGTTGSSIQLTRLATEQADASSDVSGSDASGSDVLGASPLAGIPPFLHVERVLHLGLSWQTTTTITRMNDTGVPVVVNVPLVAGESVTTEGIRVEQGAALINLAANQRVITYDAVLAISPTIRLEAPRAVPWTETWILDAATVWHCDLEGIPVVHHQDSTGQRQPQWRPWPGEMVTVHVHRPKAISGQSKTIEQVKLAVRPGMRFSQADLSMTVRTSRGGRHTVTLPPKANLQQVTVDNQALPIGQDGDQVTVPLSPGKHQVGFKWHQLAPFALLFKTPQVNIGYPAVNTHMTVQMPARSWILMTWGPRLGPAVLFWSYLLAIVLAAFVLGRFGLMPLKFWQWLLLGLGLTQVSAAMTLIIVGWLIVLALRDRLPMPEHWFAFNGLQTILAVWSVVALVALFTAVKNGLIGMPEMQIVGNHSSHLTLNWMQDRISGELPQAGIVSLPIWVYRLLMLAWALWLALALLGWLKWGWNCLAKGGMWRKIYLRKKKKASESLEGA